MKQLLFASLLIMFVAALPLRAQDFRLTKATPEQIREDIENREASVKVVNFWATWCAPCREEFPEIVRFGKDFADQGVDVVFVSMDTPEREIAVLRFLQKHGAEGMTYLKDGSSREFVSAFSEEWTGAIPATFVYGPDDKQRALWQGKVTYKKLRNRVTDILTSTQSESP